MLVADSRYTWIHERLAPMMEHQQASWQDHGDRIDRWVLNRWLGIPIFLAVMYTVFWVAINVGGALIDFFDLGVGTVVVGGTRHLLHSWHAPGWVIGLLADGVGGGIQTTATFIPQIGLLFLFIAFLEDSGYLARAAFVMDRCMRWVGLPGKAFIPMVVGFGCNIPGIMATRTLDNRRERLMTLLMNPFMSCGARLPVFALFCAAFFPTQGQNVVFFLYLTGIAIAILTGLIMKKTLFFGEASPFVMELPPYHLPTLQGVGIHAWERLKTFISRAGKMIVVMVVILGLMNSVGMDGTFGKHDSQDSILSGFSRTITPVFSPMGLRSDNWPATVGLMTGVFAKEVMVGTMDALYTQLAQQETTAAADGGEAEEESFQFWGGLQAALESIPANLSQLGQSLGDPLGLGVMTEMQEEPSVHYTTFGQMVRRFGDTHAAVAFLLFVLLYFPCVAATAAIYRETNLGWTIFVALWTTGMAYWVATFYYQLMTLDRHPLSSSVWILGLVGVKILTIGTLRWFGNQQRQRLRSEGIPVSSFPHTT